MEFVSASIKYYQTQRLASFPLILKSAARITVAILCLLERAKLNFIDFWKAIDVFEVFCIFRSQCYAFLEVKLWATISAENIQLIQLLEVNLSSKGFYPFYGIGLKYFL